MKNIAITIIFFFLLINNIMALELESSAFSNNDVIPKEYTCEGRDVSPPLEWNDVPSGVLSFAVICDDPDAPSGVWVHWVIYDIPENKSGLREGIRTDEKFSDGTMQGVSDFKKIGYKGPSPPQGAFHRYVFKLYALDKKLDLGPGITKDELVLEMKGHILAEAQLTGRFKR